MISVNEIVNGLLNEFIIYEYKNCDLIKSNGEKNESLTKVENDSIIIKDSRYDFDSAKEFDYLKLRIDILAV